MMFQPNMSTLKMRYSPVTNRWRVVAANVAQSVDAGCVAKVAPGFDPLVVLVQFQTIGTVPWGWRKVQHLAQHPVRFRRSTVGFVGKHLVGQNHGCFVDTKMAGVLIFLTEFVGHFIWFWFLGYEIDVCQV